MAWLVSIDKHLTNKIRRRLKNTAGNMERARQRAVKNTARATITRFSTLVRQDLNVKAARLKRLIKQRRVQLGAGRTVYIDISGRHLSLTDFTKTRQLAGKNGGVSFKLYRRRSREVLKHAFIATMPKTGHTGVFVRKFQGGRRAGRLPIEERFGPSAISLWSTRERVLNRFALSRLSKEIADQIQFYSSRR